VIAAVRGSVREVGPELVTTLNDPWRPAGLTRSVHTAWLATRTAVLACVLGELRAMNQRGRIMTMVARGGDAAPLCA